MADVEPGIQSAVLPHTLHDCLAFQATALRVLNLIIICTFCETGAHLLEEKHVLTHGK